MFACGIRNPANLIGGIQNPELSIRNTAQGVQMLIPLKIKTQNPNSTDKESRIHHLESRIYGEESWALESRIKLKESGIQVTLTESGNPKTTARNPESKTFLDSLVQNGATYNKRQVRVEDDFPTLKIPGMKWVRNILFTNNIVLN